MEELGGTPYLHLIKDSEEDEDGTDILVPHNLAAAALENGLGLEALVPKGRYGGVFVQRGAAASACGHGGRRAEVRAGRAVRCRRRCPCW